MILFKTFIETIEIESNVWGIILVLDSSKWDYLLDLKDSEWVKSKVEII